MERNREDNKKYYVGKFFHSAKESLENEIKGIIDCSYCVGYNTVLDACYKVLSKEDYKKVTNWLEKHGY